MKKQIMKIGGQYAASFWKMKGRYFQEVAEDAKDWDAAFLYADGRALDEALEVCRVSWVEWRIQKDNSLLSRWAYCEKMDCYIVFFEMLAVYLGIEKEA